ncbi:unnamed protein product [Alopecurus aequalis]
MAAAGGSGQEIRGNGGSQEQDEVALPQSANGNGVGTVSPHSGYTRPAQLLTEAVRKSQEEIPAMGMADLLAYQEHLRALRLCVVQRIKEEEEEKAAAAEQATAPEPRRAG